MTPKIKIIDLHKKFGAHKVLDGINLEIQPKESLVILGGSGTGKSVLIKNIIGLIHPDSGQIFIDGQNTTSLSDKDRFQVMAKCGFLFQSGALFDSFTVLENIVFYVSRLKKMTESAKRDLAAQKLEAVGLPSRVLDLYPVELSGGMQKRVSLARAICADPEIVFFDEPTTGLDPIMANVINDLIIKVRDQLGATTVTITHDMASAKAIATKVAMLYQGKILWYGDSAEMEAADNPYLHQFIHGLSSGPIEIN